MCVVLFLQESGRHRVQSERRGPGTQTGQSVVLYYYVRRLHLDLCVVSPHVVRLGQPLSVFPLNFHFVFSPIHQDNKRMKRTLEEEQRARKELERIIRRVLKNMNDPTWDETNL